MRLGSTTGTRRAMAWIAAGAVLTLLPITAMAATPKTLRVDVNAKGKPATSGAIYESVSGSGRFIAFESDAANLVKGDTNMVTDVFVRDRRTHTTTRVSVRSDGRQSDDWLGYSAISVNGRFVTFCGEATNVVKGDTNGHQDVFVHDRRTGRTTRVSVSSSGRQGNADSDYSNVSSNGRWVVFASLASNLVKGDTNGHWDLFIHDAVTGRTRLITRSRAGTPANGDTSYIGPSSMSADGRFVTFSSLASNLVAGDQNGASDVFVYDRETRRIRPVSVSSREVRGNGDSGAPTIGANGRFVAFDSASTNLVGGDGNGYRDVFIRDLKAGTTRRVSLSSSEVEGNRDSSYATISSDGRFVAFESAATNLIGGDGNAATDIFVRNLAPGSTRRVSVSSSKAEANGGSSNAFISASGAFVVFQSDATNLVANDMNGATDVFLRGPLR
jgi:hypothetical protein